jgi:hypothetical protein
MVFESVEISTPAEESPAVSWPAIAAGAIAAAAMTLVLLAFGAGMGFSAVSPWGNSGISAGIFQISTALYLMVVALLASALGGYVAGRLRTRWVGVHTHEVFFRDTAHGFLSWALATVIGAGFLAAAATNIAGVHRRDLQRQPMCRQPPGPAVPWIIMWMRCCGPILPQARIPPIWELPAAKSRVS